MRLYLISAPVLQPSYLQFLNDRAVEWKESETTSDAQRLIELSGRICYMSFGERQSPRTNSEYIANLINNAHESVLEHANFSILADGISRGLSHQLVRHRAGFSYSQLSQQYHDEADSTFVKPHGLEKFPDLERLWEATVDQSRQSYKRMANELSTSPAGQDLSNKERMRMIRSACRSVLPAATATCLMITANARAWRNLLATRGAIEGDFEMLDFCSGIFKLLESYAPALFPDFECTPAEQGHFVVKRRSL
ncbi:FAD-dependent thymidylate synthase [Noviherbaspirillum sp.]|jgi:thymidylate synthase (FAD)|uniref:FAD-dependent thymidylate synthase n=1 Tax=Noviherbaspirillum sp. TaxID=1926288 RepID=UPI0025D8E20E|nr:FAD-dependent thymidylate synthase [Noviherbaspirillum sp.]